jgi:REP element-mobilizing transposase RayT
MDSTCEVESIFRKGANMELYQGYYYHIYNRTNNKEIAFKSPENYLYFLKKYRDYLVSLIDTLAYCLMPTHFHFLVYIVSADISKIQKNIGIWLSSYTKAINKRYKRHGSLFQHHTKAVLINSDNYLTTAAAYIHQNPVVSGLVDKLEDWTYSSYQDYIGMRKGTLPKTEVIRNQFSSLEEFIAFSNQRICDDDLSAIV